MSRRDVQSSVKRIAFGGAALALLTFAAFQIHMDLASAIPLYLFAIVLQSLTGDLASSLVAAILSVFCLDFFFTAPLFSLFVHSTRNVIALVAFAFTSLVITKLVSQARKETIAAKTQKDRLDRLYRLSQELLHLDPEVAGGNRLREPFQRHFGVTAICIFDSETSDLLEMGHSDLGLAEKTRDAYIRGGDYDDPASQIWVRCLRKGGRQTGAIGFQGLHEAETASALSAVTATLLERTSAFRKASAASAAEQAEVYRSAILDALAHEFKTPLATILAAAGGLREAGPLEPAQSDMADTVEEEAARLGSLTSRLLRIARLEREDIKPRLELSNASALVSRVARQYADRSPDRRIVVKTDDSIQVLADAELLRLALSQLVENALKYSEPGSTVAIRAERQSEMVVIQVSNDGSSIPANERSLVFERFYRGADARRSTSGSGLGLYVARKIALAHGATLELESNAACGRSVTFNLTLPIPKTEVNDEFDHVVGYKTIAAPAAGTK